MRPTRYELGCCVAMLVTALLLVRVAHAEMLFGPVQPSLVTCRAQITGTTPCALWIDLVDNDTGDTLSGLTCSPEPLHPTDTCQYNVPVPYVPHAETRYRCAFVTDCDAAAISILTP